MKSITVHDIRQVIDTERLHRTKCNCKKKKIKSITSKAAFRGRGCGSLYNLTQETKAQTAFKRDQQTTQTKPQSAEGWGGPKRRSEDSSKFHDNSKQVVLAWSHGRSRSKSWMLSKSSKNSKPMNPSRLENTETW